MKMYSGDEVEIHAFLTTELNGNEWSGPRLGPCTPPHGEIITAIAFIKFKVHNILGVRAHSQALRRNDERYQLDATIYLLL